MTDDIQAPNLIALNERDRLLWNEAIEKCALLARDNGAHVGLILRLRRLKK